MSEASSKLPVKIILSNRQCVIWKCDDWKHCKQGVIPHPLGVRKEHERHRSFGWWSHFYVAATTWFHYMLCNWNLSCNLVASPLCCELHHMQVPLYLRSQLGVPDKTGGVSWTLKSDVNFLEFVHRWETSVFFFSQISIDLFNIDAHWIAFRLNFLEHGK